MSGLSKLAVLRGDLRIMERFLHGLDLDVYTAVCGDALKWVHGEGHSASVGVPSAMHALALDVCVEGGYVTVKGWHGMVHEMYVSVVGYVRFDGGMDAMKDEAVRYAFTVYRRDVNEIHYVVKQWLRVKAMGHTLQGPLNHYAVHEMYGRGLQAIAHADGKLDLVMAEETGGMSVSARVSMDGFVIEDGAVDDVAFYIYCPS